MQENTEQGKPNSFHDAGLNGHPQKAISIDRIELTPVQQQRVQNFRRQIEPLKAQVAALEQGVHAMLSTLIEMHGVPDGAHYSLTDDCAALVRNTGAQ